MLSLPLLMRARARLSDGAAHGTIATPVQARPSPSPSGAVTALGSTLTQIARNCGTTSTAEKVMSQTGCRRELQHGRREHVSLGSNRRA